MAIRDLTSERLFVEGDLAAGLTFDLAESQAHYLTTVLRMRLGARLLVFNGRDGEWAASLVEARKRGATLRVEHQTRPQEGGPDIDYLFAPLKRSRLDYMVQKATEMGVRRLRPVITERTIAERVNSERMRRQRDRGRRAMRHSSAFRRFDPPVRLQDVLANWDKCSKTDLL